ncbi:MAG: thiamine-phosphate kinase [Akkermansia sp.]
MNTPLHQVGENAIIQSLLHQVPSNEQVLLGPGDDCAICVGDAQWDALLKTDVVVEGVHFVKDTPPALIGRKALARAISDIAAMGGIPRHALITLLVHPSRSLESVQAIYQEGIAPLARQYAISLAGGETSMLPQDGLIINVALTGQVERGRAVLRSGAKAGDILCVSGYLGGSFESGRHLSFEPRLDLSRFLMQEKLAPRAMMDLSDGLATDLPRLAAASHLDYHLDADALPCHQGCLAQQALCDGEDYELLMCFSPEQWQRVQTLHLPTPITAIGHMLDLDSQQGEQGQLSGGWTHF